jgi:hypothetical protein
MQGSVPGAGEQGRSFIDDIAIGTAWEDVAQVDVPRLSLEINRTDGNGRLINNSDVSLDVNGYSIESAMGSLDADGWNSLDEQNLGNWLQNSATANQLAETQFLTAATVAPGGQLPLGKLFTVGGEEDVTARFTSQDGLLNVAHVAFVEGSVAGDLNGDGAINFGDLSPFVLALTDVPAYDEMFPELVDSRVARCDTSGDGSCNFGDLTPFVNLLTGGPASSSAVPEPASALLMAAAGIVLAMTRRQV